ncbi:MAG: AMP-binding protein [Phycisphaerae bacterium]
MTPSKPALPPRIADRLRGRRLLVTGATGLLAKVFTEKLLRSVPEIGRIHLLIRRRPSDGLTSDERVRREVFGSSIFDRLRALHGPRFESLWRDKIRVVSGDLTHGRLGLTDADYASLTREIDGVVNSAATVTFDERLDLAHSLNTLGPRRLLEFARDCGNAPFLQISTCYVSGRRSGDIPERLVDPDSVSIDLDEVLAEMKETCDRILGQSDTSGESARRELIDAGMKLAHRHGWNDTYTFTKWLGEQQVNRNRGNVPIVILRPAIIESSLAEPVPGWIDGLRMADPMIMAYGRGKLADFPGNPNVPIDIIPVDLVANAMIAALEPIGSPSGLKVYQVGSSARNTMLVSEFLLHMKEGFRRRPMLDEAGRPIRVGSFGMVGRKHYERNWRRRLRRAMAYRRWLERFGRSDARRRRISSLIVQIEQLLYYASIYAPYTHLDCRFLDERLQSLAASLAPEDREAFPFDVAAIDWPEYLINRHLPGLRKFVLAGGRGAERPIPLPRDAVPDDRRVRESFRHAETIFEAFAGAAGQCREKVALQIGRKRRWVRYTYEEAYAATASIARRFGEVGLVPGDHVAICGENCPAWGLTYLATMRAGLTAVPLDPQLPAEDVFQYARFAQVKLVCAGRTTFAALRSAANTPDSSREALPPIVEMAEPFVPPPSASCDEAPAVPPVRGDDVASILFTSGTTVAPKAVQLTQTNLLSNARAIATAQPLGAEDSFLSVLPLHHAFEFTAGFLIPLAAGATVTYVEQLKGPDIVEAMQTTRTTVMLVVPRLLKLFLDSIQTRVRTAGPLTRGAVRLFRILSDLSGHRLGRVLFRRIHRQFGGHLRLFVSGGSALDPELHAAFGRLGFTVAEGYGLTETAPVLTVNPPDGGKPGSVGRPLPGVSLELRDANSSGIGELWARGPSVMKGYLENPEATAAVMRDGWFRTGDLCRFDRDGYLYVVGRVTDTIVTDAGKNVYPDEVETRYKALPYVKEMCVVGIPHPTGTGDAIHVVIVPDFERAPDLDPSAVERTIRDMVAHLGKTVPSHQRISTVHFWRRDLPKTSTLKAKRREIRDRILDGVGGGESPDADHGTKSDPADVVTPAELSDTERFVYQTLARATHTPDSSIRPTSNLLLDLDIDSLMKLYLIGELEATFGTRCPDDTAAAITCVKDILDWIGHRRPVRDARRDGRSWRSRLHRSTEASDRDALASTNGRLPAALWPVRWAARGGLSLFFNSYIRVRSEGTRNVPPTGPFILAANHTSHLDSASVLTALGERRRVRVAAASDYFFNTRLKRWVFGRLLDAIPFDRHTDGIAGLRRCIEALGRGDGILVLPEGTRSVTGRMQPFKIGASVMAVETNAPVVPVRIDHAFELLPKGRTFVRPGFVRVAFGEPVWPEAWSGADDINDQYRMYRAMTDEIQSRVAALSDDRDKPNRSEAGPPPSAEVTP